jgi:hypothetical protein
MKRLFLCLIMVLLLPVATHGQTTNRAGLVLLGSDGNVQTYCVAFAEDTISGVELLQRAKLPLIAQTSGNNAAVCKIGNDGCDFPAEECFCRFGGGQRGEYWAFWQLNGAAWEYSQLGAGAARIKNGDVNGWAWGAGESGSGSQPPVRTFEQICDQPSAVSHQPSATSSVESSMASQVAQAEEQASAQPSNLPTFQPATPSTQPSNLGYPLGAFQPSNPELGQYALFGALMLGVIGMIVLVLRRGGR